MNERWKEFKFKLRIFLWYVATEPIRLVVAFWQSFRLFLSMFAKTLTYTYIFLVMTIIALVMNKRPVAGLFVLFLLFSIIMWEWERGFFMKRWRDYTKDNIKKKFEEDEILKSEDEKDGLGNMDKK